MNAQRSGKLCFFVAVLRNSSILLPCSESLLSKLARPTVNGD